MIIDEAIARIREVAEKHRNNIVPKERYHNMPWIDKSNEVSMRCAEEHEQLAEWLEELKFIRQWKSDIMDDFCKYDVSSFEELVTNVRNKAIDDIKEKLMQNGFIYTQLALDVFNEIAEQLKAGGTNDGE